MANPSVIKGAALGFQDPSGNFVPVSAANPLPITGGGGGAVSSVNGQTGAVVLDADDVGAATPASVLIEAGKGDLSLQAKGVKYLGQITLTNGSAAIVGVGTQFTSLPDHESLNWWTWLWVVDSAGNVYYIDGVAASNNTHATLGGSRLGGGYNFGSPSATFQGVTGTYDFYIQYSVAAGLQSVATGVASAALGDFCTTVGTYSTSSGSEATVVGSVSQAIGDYATAVGSEVNAIGNDATALGSRHTNNVPSSVTVGAGSVFARATAARWEVFGANGDVVLASPDGTRWKIGVSDLGVVTVAAA